MTKDLLRTWPVSVHCQRLFIFNSVYTNYNCISVVLSESITDIDKVVLGLRAKDFTVEKSTLQSLQQLMQWVADLALNILAKLPEARSSRNVGVSEKHTNKINIYLYNCVHSTK